ncbi:MAG: pyridoxal phosphate-dependent aminotransferase [Pseudomonadota bacterium]
MQSSQRIAAIVGGSGDDGWSVHYRAHGLAAAGVPVTRLTVGDHDVKTDASILAAMQGAMTGDKLGYMPVSGIDPLKAAIAARVTAQGGPPVSTEEVVVTPGGQAALYCAAMAALDPGQSCIVLDPFYATYQQTVRAVSARPITVETRAEDGFQPDPDAIAAALAPDTRAILINTPNNPTGSVYTRERLEGIAALCQARDLWLISDEVYDRQIHHGAHLSPRVLPGMAERTMVVNSLSKSHAMTGSRIGWLVLPPRSAEHVVDLAIAMTYGIPGFIQDAGLYALTHGGEIEDGIRARYRRRRDQALQVLGSGNLVRAVPPAGGMYVMLDIRATGLTGIAFAEALLEQERIAVMPGESFGAAAAGHVRVALTVPDEELADALGRIVQFAGVVKAA